jgi:hypothetical protein
MNQPLRIWLAICFVITFAGCKNELKSPAAAPNSSQDTSQTDSSQSKVSFQVSWTANRESAVNREGGGYRVYYSTQSNFDLSQTTYVDVPYVSGSSAPTSATVSGLDPGTYHIKVVAYSALDAGGASTHLSNPSTDVSISLP